MLQRVLEYVHNYFIKDRYAETYTISGGVFSSFPSLKEGQRFLVCGSDLNDGVYTYHSYGIKDSDDTDAVGLRDETWSGTICALAVPPQVIALSEEISQWVDKYGEAVNSPYTSENVIGVYGYTKATAAKEGGGNPAVTWMDVFKSDLNRWRRVCF